MAKARQRQLTLHFDESTSYILNYFIEEKKINLRTTENELIYCLKKIVDDSIRNSTESLERIFAEVEESKSPTEEELDDAFDKSIANDNTTETKEN